MFAKFGEPESVAKVVLGTVHIRKNRKRMQQKRDFVCCGSRPPIACILLGSRGGLAARELFCDMLYDCGHHRTDPIPKNQIGVPVIGRFVPIDQYDIVSAKIPKESGGRVDG